MNLSHMYFLSLHQTLMIHIFENYFSKKKFEGICKWSSDKGNVLYMRDYKFKI